MSASKAEATISIGSKTRRPKENMRIRQVMKHFRPRSKSSKTNHFLVLSSIGLLWYYFLWKRDHAPASFARQYSERHVGRANSYANDDQPLKKLDTSDNFEGKVTEKPRVQVEQGNQYDVNKMSKKHDKPPKKAEEVDQKSINNDDEDPFHRKELGLDNKPLQLAEREPIESEGRNLRPKLTQASNEASGNEPVILIWKAMEYQMKQYQEHLEYISPPQCGGCRVTTDRSLVRDCIALVHFNSPDLRKFLDVPDPKDRNPDQIYVFWSRETPVKTYHFGDVLKSPKFDGIFNLTMNYRLDSDIVDYFGNVEYELRFFAEKQKFNGWFEKMMARKSGLAVWAVSNCDNTVGATERMRYAKSLMDGGLDITTYGSCFNNRYGGADLVKELQRHKFYISFENSIHCPDYVSEKFWRNGLRSGAVPIVWGPTKEDVAKIAPEHSFIHTEDFSSVRELVKYVNYLDKNDKEYRKYHDWRFKPIDESISYEEIVPTHRSSFCRLCKLAVSKNRVRKTVKSVYHWLYETRYVDDKCLNS